MIRSGYHDHFDAAMAAGSTVGLATYLEHMAEAFARMGRTIAVAFEPLARLAEALGREQA
jgi:hypothetical protein